MSTLITAVQLLLPLLRKDARGPSESIGREVFSEIYGAEAKGSLEEALSQLDADEQEEWARVVETRLNLFQAATKRLEIEAGFMDARTLEVLPEEERARVAWLRMTTRPWGVRVMILCLVSPFLLVGIDVLFYVVTGVLMGLGIDHLLTGSLDGWRAYDFELSNKAFNNEGLKEFYLGFKGWAAAIVISYFGFREIGKVNGVDDKREAPLGTMMRSAGSLINQANTGLKNAKDVFRIIRKRI